MTATMMQNTGLDHQFILELKIDASGEVIRKPTRLGRKDTLQGKLFGQLYPDIRVARVSFYAAWIWDSLSMKWWLSGCFAMVALN